MGWASGSGLFSDVITAIKPAIKDEVRRKELYKKLIQSFENADWDTQNECEGEDRAFDNALKELHPDWYE